MSNWFTELCAQHELIPAAPIEAQDLSMDHVLFTATGEPRTIRRLYRAANRVHVYYADGWEDHFPRRERLSLVATRA